MIHHGIGLSLQKILPRFISRSDAEVDVLLDCKLRVYDLHIVYVLHVVYIWNNILNVERVRLKKNGKDSKEISLIGQGFQQAPSLH